MSDESSDGRDDGRIITPAFVDLPEEDFPLTIQLFGLHTGKLHREYLVEGPGVFMVENVGVQVGEYVFVRHLHNGKLAQDTRNVAIEMHAVDGCEYCDWDGTL